MPGQKPRRRRRPRCTVDPLLISVQRLRRIFICAIRRSRAPARCLESGRMTRLLAFPDSQHQVLSIRAKALVF
ncbi:hypothetical protein, partial [Klebsiella pneumoniae]|uniref:hypothetical protein n=1 Tax=Klebsiella pneumoniae TaxID=573 RepID=UPI002730EFF0